MKRLLMISYYFPPLQDVGSLRALGFSTYLPNFGWEPFVVSVKNADTSLCTVGDGKPPEGVKVFYVRSFFNVNRLTWKLNGLIKIILKCFGIELKENVVHDLICIPDAFIGWIIPCFFKAYRLARTYAIDAIYVSSKPFSSSFVGVWLKKLTKKPLIVDFRDPVSFPAELFAPGRMGKYRHRIVHKMEKYILKNADRFLVTTEETKEKYLSLYPFLRGKIARIYNGFMIGDKETDLEKYDKFTIVYTGNFYNDFTNTSVTRFFEGLAELLKNRLIPTKRVQFLYLGRIRKKANWLEKIAEEYGLEEIIVWRGHVPRDECIRTIRKSSIMLIRIVPPMISTKVFEGLAIGIPLLATITEGEVANLIRKYSKTSYVITSDTVGAVMDALLEAYKQWEKGNLEHGAVNEFLECFDKRSLTAQLGTILEQVVMCENSPTGALTPSVRLEGISRRRDA